MNRIAQVVETQTGYFLPDALGSVRQIADDSGWVTLGQSFTQFGEVLETYGSAQTDYAFTGEMYDSLTGLVYLRARYYVPGDGRFMSKDAWQGDEWIPMSYIHWLYGYANPVRYIDPSGLIARGNEAVEAEKILETVRNRFGVQIRKDWGVFIYYDYIYKKAECGWRYGNWNSLSELEIVKKSLELMSSKMGGDQKVKLAVGGTKVWKWKEAGYHWTRTTFLAPTLGQRSWAPPGVVILTDVGMFDSHNEVWEVYIVVHEMGHAWDFKTGEDLSIGMADEVGSYTCARNKSQAGCYWDLRTRAKAGLVELPPGWNNNQYAYTNRWEDWAEAFAEYVTAFYKSSPKGVELGEIRKKFVQEQIEGLN